MMNLSVKGLSQSEWICRWIYQTLKTLALVPPPLPHVVSNCHRGQQLPTFLPGLWTSQLIAHICTYQIFENTDSQSSPSQFSFCWQFGGVHHMPQLHPLTLSNIILGELFWSHLYISPIHPNCVLPRMLPTSGFQSPPWLFAFQVRNAHNGLQIALMH